MKTKVASFPAFGVDTVQTLNVEMCHYLIRNGYSFAVRYLGMLKKPEMDRILCSGLALMPVTTSRKSGWKPDGTLGKADGNKAVKQLAALNFPKKCTVWLDLEGCAGPAELTAEWVTAWSKVVKDAGYMPGLYVGANPGGLGPEELWRLPHTVRYWRGCSIVPEPARRGFCNFQMYPPNLKLGPCYVDVNVLCKDWKNDLPSWVVA